VPFLRDGRLHGQTGLLPICFFPPIQATGDVFQVSVFNCGDHLSECLPPNVANIMFRCREDRDPDGDQARVCET
jgi:hypothetical protein